MTDRRILGVLLLVLTVLTYTRVRVWRNNLTLFRVTVRQSPCLVRPHANLAMAYKDRAEPDAAVEEWRRVVELTLDHLCLAR